MGTVDPGKMQYCGLCKKPTKLVRAVATSRGTVMLGRCTTCDARQCEECHGYTADPCLPKCKHCGVPWEDAGKGAE